MKILSRPEIMKLLGVSDVTLWRMTREGRFPKPIRIGTRRIGWPEEIVQAWIEERVEEANSPAS